MDYSPQSLLPHISQYAFNAGTQIMSIYQREWSTTSKPDQTPLTDADIAAHVSIINDLHILTPEWPILSEESAQIPWEQRQTWKRYWLIDPLDGTKEFIQRNGEFTINIALIEENECILGVVYAPERGELYSAAKHHGAFLQTHAHPQLKHLRVRAHADHEPWKIVASRSHPSPALDQLLTKLKNYQLLSIGSSLKFCLVADGQAHLYPRLGPTSEWDTAAAQCIVEQAGGLVVNAHTLEPLRYNQTPHLRNPHFIVAAHYRDLSAVTER